MLRVVWFNRLATKVHVILILLPIYSHHLSALSGGPEVLRDHHPSGRLPSPRHQPGSEGAGRNPQDDHRV